MKQRLKEIRKLLWLFLPGLLISALSSRSDLHSEAESWLTFSLLWVYKHEKELCLLQMCSLLDALTNVSSPAVSAFLALLLRSAVLLGCWVKVPKLWRWAAQCSLYFVHYCSPLVQKYFLQEKPQYFFLKNFFVLARNQGSQNVKECPGKQMRMPHRHSHVWFSFRHCWGMNFCFCQDLDAVN